jgi:hypothetical protein
VLGDHSHGITSFPFFILLARAWLDMLSFALGDYPFGVHPSGAALERKAFVKNKRVACDGRKIASLVWAVTLTQLLVVKASLPRSW